MSKFTRRQLLLGSAAGLILLAKAKAFPLPWLLSGGGPPSSLVGWWPLNTANVNFGTSTANDVSGLGHNGTMANLGSILPLTFNGTTSEITIASTTDYALANFTVSQWVNFASFATLGTFTATFEHNHGGANWIYMGKSGDGNFGVWRATGSSSVDANTILSLSTDYHFCGTYNASNGYQIFYLNGIADCAVVGIAAPTPTASQITIGLGNGGTEGFHGTMSSTKDGTRLYNKALTALQVGALYKANSGVTPVDVIWDDDYCGDCDALTTQYLLLALQAAGYCTVRAICISSSNDYSAPCAAAVNYTFGITGIPIGAYQGSATPGVSEFTQQVVARFASNPSDTRTNYSSAVSVLRQALVNSAGNLVYISTGFLTNISALLQSPADGISPLTGLQLVTAKVAKFVIVGGDYPSSSSPEYNFASDPVAAAYVFNNSPVPIYSIGYTLGNSVSAGPPSGASTTTDPAAYGYSLYFGGTTSRPCWDTMAVHVGILGLSQYYNVAGSNGTNTINTSTGANSWSSTPTGDDSYLALSSSTSTMHNIFNAIFASMTLPLS